MADGLADLLHRRGLRRAIQLTDHRFEGEGHVGAGVAVGHRVDVERVQLVLVGAQGVAVRGHDPPQVAPAPASAGPSRLGWYLRPLLSSSRSIPVHETQGFPSWRPSARCAARSRSSACASATRTGAPSVAGTPTCRRSGPIVNGSPEAPPRVHLLPQGGQGAEALGIRRAGRRAHLRPAARVRASSSARPTAPSSPSPPTRSRARCSETLRQGQRVNFELDADGRAINVRLGSEVDMGLPTAQV